MSKAKALPVIRDRIIEFRRVSSEELQDNERNWRLHPYAQRAALNEALQEVGIAGALTAYYSERNEGKLTLIDGHERRGHHADWPTLILDVNDEEADLLLATFDPIGELAQMDGQAVAALLVDVHSATPALQDLLQTLEEQAAGSSVEPEEEQLLAADERTLPEMELQPYEHYDYVVLLCRSTYDWMAVQDLLGIEKVVFTLPSEKTRIGMGRVVDARRVIDLLRPPEPDVDEDLDDAA